jgi:hypothetical protein
MAASGAPAPTYQWRKNAVNISGATSSTYSIAAAAPADAGSYDCVAINTCGSATSSPATLRVCRADFNCSGTASVQDIFDFLAAYFSGNPRADINGSGAVSVQDIFDFLAAYFVGCP